MIVPPVLTDMLHSCGCAHLTPLLVGVVLQGRFGSPRAAADIRCRHGVTGIPSYAGLAVTAAEEGAQRQQSLLTIDIGDH
jgi:hypothetical protein